VINKDLQEVRKFWDSRPCNVRHSNKPLGSREYFDEVEKRKYFVEPHIPVFAEFARWTGKDVLEVGCGIGTDAVNFARAGAQYTGVELSPESLAIAKTRFDVFGLTGEFIEGNAEQLGEVLLNRTFDLIYSFGVLHHTPNLLQALASIKPLCHQDSIVKIMVYSTHSWKSKMIAIGLDQPEAQAGCPIANTYTEQEIREALTSQGFRVTDIHQDHIFPYSIEKYRQYEYVLEPWFSSMPNEMFSALEKQLGWHLMITCMLDKQKAG